jgi:IgA Peptidase M64/Peptidase M64 N-terminus
MTRILSALLLLFCAPALWATPRTMRLDYFHTGNAKEERFSFDRVIVEPLPWPGNPARPIDDTNLGRYFFEVIDRASNRVVYSRGFASIYGEWEETDEAKERDRTFSESLRFPAPEKPVRISLKKRDAQNDFREVWSALVDPKDMFVDSSAPPAPAPLLALQKSGDPTAKVDFLILGDGYTKEEAGKFEHDARRLVDILFTQSPFKEHRADFNVWGLCPPAAESGISRPSTGVHRRSPVGASYDTFGSERYVLTYDNKAFRDIAQFAPYEFVEILVNGKTYGGGGIFNLYSTVAADSLWSPYVFVHEFGHHFAGLADEYYTSDVPTETGKRVEPWEANVTGDLADLKWKDLVTPGTPLPTPWKKKEFESYSLDVQRRRREIRKANRPESDMDALFAEEREHEEKALASEASAGKVGAFEGAAYASTGLYRPQADCIMFTRDRVPFCAVCRRTIERVIALYTEGGTSRP